MSQLLASLAHIHPPQVRQVIAWEDWTTHSPAHRILPIVLLAEQLAKLVDHGIAVLKAQPAIGGVLIALIVFTHEAMSALRAALDNQLQRAVNLCLGAVSSTIDLTVPAILVIGLITGQPVVLGLSIVLLAVTLVL